MAERNAPHRLAAVARLREVTKGYAKRLARSGGLIFPPVVKFLAATIGNSCPIGAVRAVGLQQTFRFRLGPLRTERM